MAFFSDTPGRYERTPRYSQPQQGGFDLLRQLGMSGLQKGPADFQPIEDLIRYQHNTKTLPALAQNYASQGSLNSSAFNEANRTAGERMDLGLGALRIHNTGLTTTEPVNENAWYGATTTRWDKLYSWYA